MDKMIETIKEKRGEGKRLGRKMEGRQKTHKKERSEENKEGRRVAGEEERSERII
jgi:hypothetical protein